MSSPMLSTSFDGAIAPASALPDPAQSALVIVDATPEALPAGTPAAETLRRLLTAARRAQTVILFLQPERGADEANLDDSLAPQPGPSEFVVRTLGGSPFGTSTFGLVLRANGITDLVRAGSDESLGIACTVRDAAVRGYRARRADVPQMADAIAAAWLAARPGPRNWHAEAKQAALLRTLDERLAPQHTALVLIDVQNDFVSPTGATGRREAMPMVDRATARIPVLLRQARDTGCLVVHVRAEYGQHVRHVGSPYRFPSTRTHEGAVWSASAAELDGNHEFPPGEVEVCLRGSWGGQVIDAVAPLPGEPVITKHRFSAFIDTPLEALLRARGIRTLVFAGVTTNCCIESSARDASMLDFYLVVAEDCVGTKNSVRHLHEASLEQLRTYFALVEPSERIIDAWQAHVPVALATQ
ncbi:hypothetical protein BH10PSE18_BH10PSE18_15710 [soil metagenome]